MWVGITYEPFSHSLPDHTSTSSCRSLSGYKLSYQQEHTNNPQRLRLGFIGTGPADLSRHPGAIQLVLSVVVRDTTPGSEEVAFVTSGGL